MFFTYAFFLGYFFSSYYRDIVKLLLINEASTNIVDVKGSSPLHLAAWSGNVDIVRMLLCHGPSIPNVNLMVCVHDVRIKHSMS